MNTHSIKRKRNLNLEHGMVIAPRAARGISRTIAVVSAGSGLFFLVLATGAVGLSSRGNPVTGDAAGAPFVTAYGNRIKQVQYGLTPESVGATADGGYIALGLTDSANGVGANWLLKLDGSGRPKWQKELLCANGAPGDYALGVSAQQTSDGGYVLGGGILGCGGSYIQKALVEKLDAQGKVMWAFNYPAGSDGSSVTQIRQTTDGGYIAVGSVTGNDLNLGAFIFKLDSAGTLQWERELDPTGSSGAYFNAVQQTSDGGYVAIGEHYILDTEFPYPTSVLVATFDSSGKLRWQKGFNNTDESGAPSGYEHALAGIQTSDGGFLVGGNWSSLPPSPFPVEDTAGDLLLKLDSNGNIEWQKAYNGGIYCYFNGFNTVCTIISALTYSTHETADDGYVLGGLGNLELLDSVPQVPWLAKVDFAGNLLWQYFYYDLSSAGRTLSQYFASSTPTSDEGFIGLGFTESNDPSNIGELYAVKTDGVGLLGNCDQQHDATPLHSVDPMLTAFATSLPVVTTASAKSSASIRSRNTSVIIDRKCP